MTDFMLVRHGTPDYSYINGKKFRGFGNDLAPLTEDGEKEAIAISMAPELQDADLILSSPHTRTLQTAAIIAKELDIRLIVEVDLMEWIADKTFMYDDYNQVVKWREHYEQNDGKNMYPGDKYDKIIVVNHGMNITALTGVEKPGCTQIIKYNLD